MRVLCVFGRHQYGDPERGMGVEYAAFIPALRRLGHEVRHFESWDRTAYRDFGELNASLLEAVEDFRPDVMLTVHMGYELWLETLESISARGDVATVSWAADDSWKYREVSRFVGQAYHAMTTTYDYVVPWYGKDGIRHVLLTQWGVPDEWLAEPQPARACRYKVSFVGAAHGNRRRQMEALQAAGIEVACFGHGWTAGPIATADIPRIMRESVISLNFANSRGVNQIKARTFEVPGSGGFLLTEHAPGLDRYFEVGAEVAVFNDVDQLAASIRHFLTHEEQRDAMALASYRRAATEHTYSQRMKAVLDYARQAKESGPAKRASGAFEAARARHHLNPPLRALGSILRGAGCALFGPERGPRAARRLVFELSWRLAGRHTFTGAGWPGRMFPDC